MNNRAELALTGCISIHGWAGHMSVDSDMPRRKLRVQFDRVLIALGALGVVAALLVAVWSKV
jgi:hypothetical protein